MTLRRILGLVVMMLGMNAASWAGSAEEDRLSAAARTLVDIQAIPDKRVPDLLLQRAQGIAIIPNVVKAGLGIGGQGGKGVLAVRDAHGQWSNPSFIMLAGGSVGFQFGVEASDVVLVFTTRRSIEGLSGGKVTLGGDASIAVGPVGRQATGATDLQFDAEVYSYASSVGLFGGIAINGTVIAIDHKANARYYQRPGVLASDIFAGTAPAAPASAAALMQALRKLPNGGSPAPVKSSAPAAAAETDAPRPAPNDGRGLESGGATTAPLEPR
jgi:lipid-binding SYLF domain-containing protein